MTAYLNAVGLVCAIGDYLPQVRERLFAGDSPGMQTTDRYSPDAGLMLGLVQDTDRTIEQVTQRSRNNRIAAMALEQIRPELDATFARFDRRRVAIVLGTSTSGIAEGEAAIAVREREGSPPAGFHYGQQELDSAARYFADLLDLGGPAWCISTACTSSAKALASGARLLDAGLVDAVIAGGVDSLCRFTVAGFRSLDAVASERCLPLSRNRRGINIGEGAAVFLMTREPGPVRLAGWGESSDAYHISAPDPAGEGARRAIAEALARARLEPDAIGYVNLHGTATVLNDAMESRVVNALLPGVPASSTKPLTGHTLGAAGAIEAAIGWLTLTDRGRLPPHVWDGVADPELPPLTLPTTLRRAPIAVLSNSFAFGGNNVALVLAR